MTGVLNVDTIADNAGTGPVTLTKQLAPKATSYFNGTGTVAIRDSFNHSTLTDLGTGRYQLTMTNSMSDGNYAQSSVRQSYHLRPRNEDPTSSVYKLDSDYVSGTSGQMTGNDAARCHTIIVGDLA